MQKNQALAYKYALVSILFWSTTATVLKVTLRHMTPLELLFYSACSSLFILGVILVYQKKLNHVYRHIKKQSFLVLLLGSINPFVYYFILFSAYNLLPAQEAQAINYTWALMFAYLSVIFFKA